MQQRLTPIPPVHHRVLATLRFWFCSLAQWFSFQCSSLRQFLGLPRRVAGQGLVEYSLILGLIAMVVIATIVTVGQRTGGFYDDFACRMPAGEEINTNC
jgi:Flp pilus assembly pilin Flp